MRRTTSAVLALIAAASALTACGSSPQDGPQPAPAATSATQSTPAQSTATPTPLDSAVGKAPEFPSGTGPQLASNEGGWDLVLRDVRVSDRDGFDRVVVEFRGTGTPGWSARYVKTPRAEGSGDVVDVGGDNVLAVSISGVTFREAYPDAPEDFFEGPRHFTPHHGGSSGTSTSAESSRDTPSCSSASMATRPRSGSSHSRTRPVSLSTCKPTSCDVRAGWSAG